MTLSAHGKRAIKYGRLKFAQIFYGSDGGYKIYDGITFSCLVQAPPMIPSAA